MKYGRWKREARRLLTEYEMAKSRPVSVFVFGATGDRITDDTAAIQATLDFVAEYGGSAWFPNRTYRVTGPITLPRA